MKALRVVTLSGDPQLEPSLAVRLGSHPVVELVMRCLDRVELLGAIRGLELDAIVSVGAPTWLDPQTMQEASDAGVRIVGVSDDPAAVHELSSRGVKVLGSEQDDNDIVAACRTQPLAPAVSLEHSSRRGRLIAVWGPKGAPGRTMIAIRLALQISRGAPDTLLIDADPYGGDVLQAFGIVEELPTVVWAANAAAKQGFDAQALASDLRRAVPGGPVVIPGLPRAELWGEVSDFGWRRLLDAAQSFFAFTVCDVGFCLEPDLSPYPGMGEGRNRMARAAAAAADHVVAVVRADALGIKSFLWGFESLTQICSEERVIVVLNRVRRGEENDVARLVRRHTGKRVGAVLFDRPQLCLERLEQNGKWSSLELPPGIRDLAAAVGAVVPPQGVLTRMAGRR
jgi:cellulose biosynthesis protein BcsQ